MSQKPRHMIVQQAHIVQRAGNAGTNCFSRESALRAFEMGIPMQKPKAAGVTVSEKGAGKKQKEKPAQNEIREWEKRMRRRDIEERVTAVAGAILCPAAMVTGGLVIEGHFAVANPVLGVALVVGGLAGLMKTIDFAVNWVNWRN